jgi:hypothetical protein
MAWLLILLEYTLHLKRNKMTDFIPYFAGIITILFRAFARLTTVRMSKELQK